MVNACRILPALLGVLILVGVHAPLAGEEGPPKTLKHGGAVGVVTFAPDGQTLATASTDRQVRVWDLATGQERLTLTGHTDTVLGLSYAPDGRLLASCGQDRTVRLWEVATGNVQRVMKVHTGTVNKVAFFPDGQTLASASDDETVRICEATSGRELRRIFGGRQRYAGLAISPDGQHVYTAGASRLGDNFVRQWDAMTAKETQRLGPSPARPTGLAIAPDGQWLAVTYEPGAKADHAIRLWDVKTAKATTLEGHQRPVTCLAFSLDRKWLVSGSQDGSVRLWDLKHQAEEKQLQAANAEHAVLALAVSPDSRTVAYGTMSGTVGLLPIPASPPAQPVLAEKKPGGASLGDRDRGIVSSESRPGRIDPGKDKDKGGMIKPGEAPRARRLIKEGDVFFVEVGIARQGTHRIQGLALPTQAQYRILTRVSVEKRGADGRWSVRQRIEDAKLDSADETTRSLIADAIGKMAGTVHKFTLNDQFEVVELEGVEDPLQAKGGLNLFGGQAAMTSVLDKDGWKELLQMVFFSADQPLTPGAKWERAVRHAWGPLGQWTGSAHYVQQGKQANLHKISYRLELKHGQAKGGSLMAFQLVETEFKLQEGSGELVFDVDRQRVTTAEELFRVKGSMTINLLGQKTALDVEEEQRFRVRVSDRSPWQR